MGTGLVIMVLIAQLRVQTFLRINLIVNGEKHETIKELMLHH